MNYTFQHIINILDDQLITYLLVKEEIIKHFLFDSRLLTQSSNTLFFAFTSSQNDGHQYINALYKKGVNNFLIEKEIDFSLYPTANFIRVTNSLKALQTIATHHREQFNLPVIGITGSNGKTIVKEWLEQLLTPFYQIIKSPKSYNSQIGVPISVWGIKKKHELGIFEAGVSQVGEMQHLAPIIKSSIGLFTNIGDAHNIGFESLEQKIKEKLQLFQFSTTIIHSKDHVLIDKTIHEIYPQKNVFTWAIHQKADLQITKIEKEDQSTTIKGIFKQKELQITIPFTDDASIENILHCWAIMLFLNIETNLINFDKLTPVALRLELKAGINNCTLINDSYSTDLNSLAIALNFLHQQNTHPNLTLILSDILQTGQAPALLYPTIADLIIQKQISKFIGIGNEIQQIKPFLPKTIQSHFFKKTTDFIQQLQLSSFQNESILLKGARKFEFEQISQLLVRKVHKTVLEIDLNALTHNLKVYKKQLQPQTKIMAMVKASAYGSGSGEVAKLLEFQKIDYLAVAYADEAFELRTQGIKTPILILNPDESSFAACLRYKVEPEIYTFTMLQQFIFTVQTNQNHIILPFPIHIKLDTGMHRLGFEEKDLEQLQHILNQNNKIVKVASIFSHLAATDNAEHDDFTRHQIEVYQKMYEFLATTLGYSPIRHILNSGGIVRFKEHQMDMVRLGIGLYGIDSSAEIQKQLQNVSTLKATISQIKTIPPTETVGYDRSGKLNRPTRTATISIGYADGLSRSLSKGKGTVIIRGKEAPILGNVCMDMCMVNINHIPTAREGDEVIIFGKSRSISSLAQQMNTIPYEIFTNISERVKRVYFQE